MKTRDFKIDIMGYSEGPGVGYIRFESNGEYLGSLSPDDRLHQLKEIHRALGNMINQKKKGKKK